MGAICLGPSGLLVPLSHLQVPCPPSSMDGITNANEVKQRINAIGAAQQMPTTLTYANRYGNEIADCLNDLSSAGSSYVDSYESDDNLTYDSDYDSSYDSDSAHSASDDTNDDDDHSDNDDDNTSNDIHDNPENPITLPPPTQDCELQFSAPNVAPPSPSPRSCPSTGVNQPTACSPVTISTGGT
eukprot:CAMPEP_0178933344 /NCGR_PEP_ID=MMETSP0786-20121207/23207_1 /TAXON_ID=186022 /ORGANISM="Thalassionema frauenfeldii, Strain CCMP 1798" /LENGTH=184 /DNA_ID=CAMNT_0020610909 /DNA_START=822 /DNA_END=1377 /DNA_ORIENTATION=+